jgi:hypothetical protein
VRHGAEAGAAGPVPAGAQGAVLHSAQAAVQVSLYCSQCIYQQVPAVQVLKYNNLHGFFMKVKIIAQPTELSTLKYIS